METSNERKAGSLILSQIAMFNEASVLFNETVQPEVLNCIDLIVENFCKQSDRWTGKFDLQRSEDCWLSLKDWNRSQGNDDLNFIAWFGIGEYLESSDDSWIAVFCNAGVGGSECGLKFSVDHSVFGGKQAWKNFVTTLDQKITTELESAGFKNIGRQNEGCYFIPFHLNAETLASAYEDTNGLDYEHEAFDPVREALKKIDASVEVFQKIISQAPKNNS